MRSKLFVPGSRPELFAKALPAADRFGSPRALAFAMLGVAAAIRGGERQAAHRALLERGGALFADLLAAARRPDWAWFEAVLSYDNARLPQALIEAGAILDNAEMIATGLETLDWIIAQQLSPEGLFRPVGTDSFGKAYAQPLPFDQQPVDATATIEACATAWRISRDARWIAAA